MKLGNVFLMSLCAGQAACLAKSVPSVMLQPELGLATVQRPASAAQRYGPQTITPVRDSAGRSRFEDNLISVTFFATGSSVAFDLINRTDTPIQIGWTEAAFVDPKGQSMPVMHGGVKYDDCAAPKAPSVIVAKGRLTDSATPCNYLRFATFYDFGVASSRWVEDSYLGLMSVRADSAMMVAQERSKELAGKPIRLLLPIKTGENVNDYTFSFEVRSVNLPTADGVWKGLIGGQTVAMKLVQNARAISGVATVEGTAAPLKVEAIADGTSVSGTMTAPTYSIRFQGTLTGPSIDVHLNGAGFQGEILSLYRQR